MAIYLIVQLLKRERTLPLLAEGEQFRQMLRTRVAGHDQDGDAVMSNSSMPTVLRGPANTRGIWPELWLKLGESWPASAAAVYPHVHRGTDVWLTVAQRELKLHLYMIESFRIRMRFLAL